MARLLYRLGRFAAQHAWRMIGAWIAVLALVVVGYLALAGTLTSSFSLPGTPTQRVTAHLAESLPEAAGATGQIVFSTADGSAFTAEQQQQISQALAAARGVDGVQGVLDPFTTQQQREAQAKQVTDGQAQLTAGRADLESKQAQLDAARKQAEAAGAPAKTIAELDAQQAQLDAARTELETKAAQLEIGQAQLEMAAKLRTVAEDGSAAVAVVTFKQTGSSVPTEVRTALREAVDAVPVSGVDVDYSSVIVQDVSGILGIGEIAGVLIAAIVLLVMLRAIAPATLPILTALTGVGVGTTGALMFSGVVDMVSVTPVLGVMLGLAVGIDYSLFILNRHRRQLAAGMELYESIGTANGTSGTAVVFAGATVIVALVALNVTGIGFLGLMGSVAAVCVAIAVLVAVTLTPAMLGLLKARVLPRSRRTAPAPAAPGRRSPMSTARAAITLVAGVAALAVIALPAMSMRLGLPDGSSEPEDSTQFRAYEITAERFGEGVNGTLLVVADLPAPDRAVWPEGADQQLVTQVAHRLFEQPDVVAVAAAGNSADGTVVAYQVIPAHGPTSQSTEDLVHGLRDLSGQTERELDVSLGVAGIASGNIDISAKLADALPLYLTVVLGLSLVIMILVFRSLLVPLMATLGFLLSVLAAFGGVVAIYQWGWLEVIFGVHHPGPVLSFLPTLLIGVLFGLAVDYQLFLVSGMREAYVHGTPARSAVMEGFHAGRAVVTAAAIIMISVFGGFIHSSMAMIRPMGFGLAFGVLADAFVVRMGIIPALMHLVGRGAWWLPRWLDRLLPNVDVEGAGLERSRHQAAPVEAAQPEPGEQDVAAGSLGAPAQHG